MNDVRFLGEKLHKSSIWSTSKVLTKFDRFPTTAATRSLTCVRSIWCIHQQRHQQKCATENSRKVGSASNFRGINWSSVRAKKIYLNASGAASNLATNKCDPCCGVPLFCTRTVRKVTRLRVYQHKLNRMIITGP